MGERDDCEDVEYIAHLRADGNHGIHKDRRALRASSFRRGCAVVEP